MDHAPLQRHQHRSLPGACFVKAPEYDASEVFLTKAQARSYVYENFSEFLH
jgi:hypothetical protein